MYYSDEIVEEVRSRNNIVDVISGYVKLTRKGSSYMGLCPFHNEKTPSFSVNASKQIYHCFGCGAGGDVYRFIQEYENYSFQEAVQFLAGRVGIVLPEGEDTAEDRRQRDLRNQVLEVHKIAAKYYYYLLRSQQGEGALRYLMERGLSQETIRSFGLGYAGKYSSQLYQYLKKQGISDEVLRASGLVIFSEKGVYDKFWNRVMFPIMDLNRKVIGFGGRVMGDAKPKYLNSPETLIFNKSRNLYGLYAAKNARKKQILVCEGYMDVIAMHQAGFTNAVASLGTALTGQHAALLKRYTDEVILTYDSDEAGIRAAQRAMPIFREAGISTRVLHLEPYKDPDEFIKALGPEAFQERIDQAENSFLFDISVLERGYDLKDPDRKTRFCREMAARIANLEQEIERENYIAALAEKYHVSFEGLRSMVQKELLQGSTGKGSQLSNGRTDREQETSIEKVQKRLLNFLAETPALYRIISEYLQPQDFEEGLLQNVAGQLFVQAQEGKCSPAGIVSSFQDPEMEKKASRIFYAQVMSDNERDREKAIRENLSAMLEYKITEKSKSIDVTDLKGMQELIREKRQLQELGRRRIIVSDVVV